MKKLMITLSILSLVLFILLSTVDGFAQRPGNRPGKDCNFMGHRHDGFWSKLTDEQRTAVQAKIKELRDQDATREEIHNAVKAMLQDWGIELPENWDNRPGFRRLDHRPDDVFSQLTEDQRKELHEKIKTLREQDTSREDIKAAVKSMLESWGIELPENWDQIPGFHPFHRGRMGFMGQLTEEQQNQVREKIQELKDQDASREEIRAAIGELLKQFGIEPPEGRKWRRDRQSEPGDGNRFGANQNVENATIEAKNSPNPFNPETNISYKLQNMEHVKVSIYNVHGQLIRTLVDEIQPAGSYTVRWDGLKENGEKAVSGMYLYRIDAGKQTLTHKMILMK